MPTTIQSMIRRNAARFAIAVLWPVGACLAGAPNAPDSQSVWRLTLLPGVPVHIADQQQPPPPPPPPVMPARRIFIIFFDFDKTSVGPEGVAVLQQAAAAYRAGGVVSIIVTGHTDGAEQARAYNQRLSEHRAENLSEILTRLGVPGRVMTVLGRANRESRVPRAPGVREPQNRRAEIQFR